MAAQLIEAAEIIPVSSLAVCIYGPPGVGKTSLAQTAAVPLTLDLDRGAHRSTFRKSVMRFDHWKDIEHAWAEIKKRDTVVVDTMGRALDLLSLDVIEGNAKMGTRAGGLSLQGFGALKLRFAAWNNALINQGKDRIFLCHEKEEKDGDQRIMRPDIQGGSYAELMKSCDIVGYLYRSQSGARILDCNPSDRHHGKNPAGWEPLHIGQLEDHPTCLADLLADAKEKIGKTAEASSLIAQAVDNWRGWLSKSPDLATFNANLVDLGQLTNGAKKQAWHLLTEYATQQGWTFSREHKAFVPAAQPFPAGHEEPAA